MNVYNHPPCHSSSVLNLPTELSTVQFLSVNVVKICDIDVFLASTKWVWIFAGLAESDYYLALFEMWEDGFWEYSQRILYSITVRLDKPVLVEI